MDKPIRKYLTVEDIIKYLRENFELDDEVSMDCRWHDEELYYDEDAQCVFGRMK